MKRNRITFKPLCEDDLPLMTEWLNHPHLQEWWRSGNISPEGVREKYLPRIFAADAAIPFLCILNGSPAGYSQYYSAADGDPDWWPDKPGEGVYGIDQFIGDPDLLGQGIGTDMIAEFIEFLLAELEVKEIRVDPRPDNLRAIRCYEKVGFENKGLITTPDGPAVMMILNANYYQKSL